MKHLFSASNLKFKFLLQLQQKEKQQQNAHGQPNKHNCMYLTINIGIEGFDIVN